jgi:16S rRNA (guanine527-N7)-methyltransferase
MSCRLLDVGSGAGLPGAVLAIMQPTLHVTCIDAVAKKAGFIRQAAGELAITNLSAEHARVEEWKAAPFDVVTSRAFASLSDFTALTRHLLSEGGVWLAMKGRVPDDEVAALPPTVVMFHVEPLRVPGLDAQRCIVWMRQQGQA